VKNIVTIGKFEGMHLGHRALLTELIHIANRKNLIPTTIIFDPHPYKLLHDSTYKPLFTPHERDGMLKKFGIQNIITLPFKKMANMEPICFCKELAQLADIVVVGENFRFGKDRKGTIETLLQFGFEIKTVGLRPDQNLNVLSTSKVRELLAESKLAEAAEMLGFSFFIEGIVTKGRQLGRVLGFPTLNIYPTKEKFLPAFGVYETRIYIDGGEPLQGLTNVGLRPTVETATSTISVETHIPTLIAKPNEMYNRHIKVDFIRFIRAERRFDSTEELQVQIKKDIEELQK